MLCCELCQKKKNRAASENDVADMTKSQLRISRIRKNGYLSIDVNGEIMYKNMKTSQIFSCVQLGIENSLKKLAAKPERDLLMHDFMTSEETYFPSAGTGSTSIHSYTNFSFKVYAPIAFRYFRDLCDIQKEDFLTACCNRPLVAAPLNPTKNGSLFYFTYNDDFVFKTILKKDCVFLQSLLPGYYLNFSQNPCTLLPKYFGLYRYKCHSKSVTLVVMNNILPSNIDFFQKYDIKGSMGKREVSNKNDEMLKDVDFVKHYPNGLFLEPEIYNVLAKTIKRDCRVLESFQMVNYSLLLGLHKVENRDEKRQTKRKEHLLSDHVSFPTLTKKLSTRIEIMKKEEKMLLEGIKANDIDGNSYVLYVGIIDILHSYTFKNKVERFWKLIFQCKNPASACGQDSYARQFKSFIFSRVFRKVKSVPERSSISESTSTPVQEESLPPASPDPNFCSSIKFLFSDKTPTDVRPNEEVEMCTSKRVIKSENEKTVNCPYVNQFYSKRTLTPDFVTRV